MILPTKNSRITSSNYFGSAQNLGELPISLVHFLMKFMSASSSFLNLLNCFMSLWLSVLVD